MAPTSRLPRLHTVTRQHNKVGDGVIARVVSATYSLAGPGVATARRAACENAGRYCAPRTTTGAENTEAWQSHCVVAAAASSTPRVTSVFSFFDAMVGTRPWSTRAPAVLPPDDGVQHAHGGTPGCQSTCHRKPWWPRDRIRGKFTRTCGGREAYLTATARSRDRTCAAAPTASGKSSGKLVVDTLGPRQ